jgi:hypothetical protein
MEKYTNCDHKTLKTIKSYRQVFETNKRDLREKYVYLLRRDCSLFFQKLFNLLTPLENIEHNGKTFEKLISLIYKADNLFSELNSCELGLFRLSSKFGKKHGFKNSNCKTSRLISEFKSSFRRSVSCKNKGNFINLLYKMEHRSKTIYLL